MPSCQHCGKWFSEEDNGCGCENETLIFTRRELALRDQLVAAKVCGVIATTEAHAPKGGKRRLTAGELQMLACEFRKGVRKVPVVSPLR